ncbi:MAG: hypothetical protein FWD01_02500 [Defluviitaleaceae bacterium]|nr:hypothetical protein [Defluviitaleaceae bacterium]
MKKLIKSVMILTLVAAFSTTVFAGGHGHNRGRHHSSRTPARTWHTAPNGQQAHWSDSCADYGHTWNRSAGRWTWHH